MIDLAPELVDFFKPTLDKIFTDGLAHDAVIIGHGDYIIDPDIQDSSLDRAFQMTPVFYALLALEIFNKFFSTAFSLKS